MSATRRSLATLHLLRDRNFALLWLAGLISNAGNWLLIVALPVYVYEETGSTLATGGMFLAQGLPFVLFSSLAGVFVDRWDRRRTMVVTDVLRAAVLLLLLFVSSADRLWLVYVVAFLQAMLALFFGPAENALIPTLVGKEQLSAANALNVLNDSIPRLVGPPLGGFLLVWLGLPSVALIDSGSFLISAAMVSLINLPRHRLAAQATIDRVDVAATAIIRFWQEWLEGLRIVHRQRMIALVFIALGIASIGDGPTLLLLVAFVSNELGGDSREFGWVLTARGVGGLLGGLLIGSLAARVEPPRLLAIGLVATGLLFAGIAKLPTLPVTLVLMALTGIAVTAWAVSATTMIQGTVDTSYHGRVFGSYINTVEVLALLGIALASTLGSVFGVVPLMVIVGALFAAGGVVSFLIQSRAVSGGGSPSDDAAC